MEKGVIMPRTFLLRFCAALCLLVWVPFLQAAGLEIGQRAPDFKLQGLLSDSVYDTRNLYRQNELTVLIFWTTNCPDCSKALKSCRDLASRTDSLGVKVVGINFDTESLASARSLIRGEKIDFVNLSDFQGAVATMFQAESYDFSSFIVDRKGTLRHVGYDHPPDVDKVLLRKVREILGIDTDDRSKDKPRDGKGDKDRKI